MQRTISLIAALLLTIALTSGCASNKDKPKEQANYSSHDLKNKASPDKFESSEDPPINANTRFAAGQLAESQGNAQLAEEQYREALKLDPNHRDAAYRLAALLMQGRQFPQAIEAWQKYVEVTKGAPEAYNDLALCYEAAGQMDKAEQTYKTAIARDPVHSPCRVNYGLMLARHNRLNDAVAQLSTALSPAEVSYNLGRVFQDAGQFAQARAYFEDALKKDPNLHDAKAALAAMK